MADKHTTEGDAGPDPLKDREDFPLAYEVMDLVLRVTQTSADVYAMIAGTAECMQEPSGNHGTMGSPERRRLNAALFKVEEANKITEAQLRSLDSQTAIERPHILKRFLEDCWATTVSFREVCGLLTEIMELDGWENPSATASDTLLQIMKRLQTTSEKVSGLPGSGLAVSSHCLARTALDLQRRAGRFVEKAASLS